MADIPVNANDAYTLVTVTSNGQVSFDYDFRADDVEDIRGFFRRLDGSIITIVGGVDFTATGLETAVGGTITLTSILNSVIGEVIAIYRDTVIDRPNDYARDVFAVDINAEQDTIFMILQELSRDIDRAAKSPIGATGFNISPLVEDGDTLMKMGADFVPGPNLPDLAASVIAEATAEADRSRDEADRSQAARDVAAGYASDAVSQGNVPIYGTAIGLSGLSIPDGINFIRTNGYHAVGDFGAAKYRLRSAPEASRPGDQISNGGTKRWEIAEVAVTPEMFGAKGDCVMSGLSFVSGTDDLPAFQAAVSFSRRLMLPRAEVAYRLHGQLDLPRFQSIIGYSMGNSDSGSLIGAPKLVFTGAGTHCIGTGSDGLSSHSKICGFVVIDANATKAYDYLMNFKQCIEVTFEDIKMQSNAFGTSGFRGYKTLLSDVSWSNRMSNVKVRLPDASIVDGAGRTLDLEWSDSTVEDCQFTGGIGSIDRGIDVRYAVCQFERSFYAGMTVTKKADTKRSSFLGCNFDGNWQIGLLFETNLDTTTRYYMGAAVIGCCFRTLDPNIGTAGISNIRLDNSRAGIVYMGPIIVGCEFQLGTPARITQVGSWSSTKMVGNSATGFNTQNFGIEDDLLVVDTTGIKVPRGPIVARGAATLYGEVGSGFFGGTAANVAGVVLGHDGTNPFVGTTNNGSGSSPSSLAFRLNGQELLRLTSDRQYVRPTTDGQLNLGTPGNRFNTLYATTGSINTSDERLKREIRPVDDDALDAWGAVEWVQFRFVDGERLHTGLIAQRIKEAFEAKGLDATNYGLLCFDEWDDEYEEQIRIVYNEDGTPKMQSIIVPYEVTLDDGSVREMTHEIDEPVVETVSVLVKAAGNLWSVRYDEALAMEAAWVRRELKKR